MWEFAANHPGWFFLYMLVIVPCSAFMFLMLLLLISDTKIKVRKDSSPEESRPPKEFGNRPNESKVSLGEKGITKDAGTTRH